MNSRAHYLQQMGIQTYLLRSCVGAEALPEPLRRSQGHSSIDTPSEPSAVYELPVSGDVRDGATPAVAPAPQVSAEAAEPARPDAACDYLWCAAGHLVLFAVQQAGLNNDQRQLFAAISQSLCGDSARSGSDRWQPFAGKSSDRKRTLRSLAAELVAPENSPALVLFGADAGSIWSEQQWDLLQGSRQAAEPPFTSLCFAPALDDMLQRPYLKAQLWQLTRELIRP